MLEIFGSALGAFAIKAVACGAAATASAQKACAFIIEADAFMSEATASDSKANAFMTKATAFGAKAKESASIAEPKANSRAVGVRLRESNANPFVYGLAEQSFHSSLCFN